MKATIISILFLISTIIGSSLCLADIIIIVHPDSKIPSISQRELKRIFLGKSHKLVGFSEKVQAINLPDDNSSRLEFSTSVLKKTKQQLRSYWVTLVFSGKATPPIEVKDTADMKNMVQHNPRAIGYIDKEDFDDSVKILSISP